MTLSDLEKRVKFLWRIYVRSVYRFFSFALHYLMSFTSVFFESTADIQVGL